MIDIIFKKVNVVMSFLGELFIHLDIKLRRGRERLNKSSSHFSLWNRYVRSIRVELRLQFLKRISMCSADPVCREKS